jgi:hypothetical protein
MPPDVDLVIPQRTRVTTSSSGAENNRSGPTPQSDGIYNHPWNETNKSQLQPGAKPKPKWKMFDD